MADAPHPTTDLTWLRLSMDWRWHRPKRRADLPKGEPRHDERPVKCELGDERFGAPADALPFADRSIDEIDCGHVFAYVRNDEGLARELARVVRQNGRVRLSVPATGLLAGLDAYNLHRYLVDVSGRGLRPFETAEIGWRRHFGIEDLRLLFPESEWTITRLERTGLAIDQAVRLGGFVGFRWLRPSRDRYRRAKRWADQIETKERRLTTPFGFWFELELVRTAT